MNEDKEKIMLSKIIVGVAVVIGVITFPPIILMGILAYAIHTLYQKYGK